MIAKGHRFHGRNSLKAVYQNGRTVRSPLLALRYSPSRRTAYRAAVVISRKVHKSAVVRNRMRRRIYEQVRMRAAQFTQPYDLVFTVFSDSLLELQPAELRQLVNDLLKKAYIVSQQGPPPKRHAIVEPKERAAH